MKISKNTFIKLTACGLLVTMVTGCETIKSLFTNESKFEKIQKIVETGVTYGTRKYISSVDVDKRDKVTSYFLEAGMIIESIITVGEIQPDVIKQVITEKINNSVEPPYNVAITTVLQLALAGYNKFYAVNVKDNIANAPKAAALLQSIANGLYLGTDPVSSGVSSNPLEGYDDWEL